MPSRGFDVATVDSSVVPPTVTCTAPAASDASLPVSRVIVRPAALIGPETEIALLTRRFLSVRARGTGSQLSASASPHLQGLTSGRSRLTTDIPSRRLLRMSNEQG